jgi:hypothetical protein
VTPEPDGAVLLRPLFDTRDGNADAEHTVRPYLVDDERQVRALLGRERRTVESWPELFLAVDRSPHGLRVEARLYLPPDAPDGVHPQLVFDLGVESVTVDMVAADEDGSPAPSWCGDFESVDGSFLPARVRLAVGGGR